MTLPVPLTVRVGDQHVTQQVKSLSFRKEAVGGCRSISFGLARPLSGLAGIDPLAKVTVYDARTAAPVVDGRLADTGRGATPDGPQWDCVVFGPAQAASDWTGALIYLDRDFGAWQQVAASQAEFTFGSSSRPDGVVGPNGLVSLMPSGLTMSTQEYVTIRYDRIRAAGQKLAAFTFNHFMGLSSSDIKLDGVTANVNSTGGYTAIDTPTSANFSTVASFSSAVAGINFTTGRDVLDIRMIYNGVGGGNGAGWWAFLPLVVVRATTFTKAGVEITGVTYGNLTPQDVVADLLGRPGLLDQFDGTNATIDTTSTQIVDQLAYPDGITPAQVLEDLMALDPARRWYATPDTTGGGYGFRWELWPTTVRYEATLDDGGSFPLSTQGIYNRVAVRWKDSTGATKQTIRTRACALLDNAGIVRQAQIDLASEAGSEDQAIAAGDAFLDEHNVPKNSGTLTVARAIRDVQSGAMVQPWEIEPGELVRILGVEAYPDAFNTTTSDGQGVFRIHAVDYTTEGNVATLALDTDPRSTADALVQLMKERTRR